MALSCHQRIMNNICQARPISLTQWLFSMAQLQLPVRERNWSSSIDLVWICKLYFDAELGWATCMYSLSFSIGTHEWSGCSSLCPENVTGSQTELDPWHCNNFQYHHHHHHHHLHHLTIITTSLSSPPHHLTTSPPLCGCSAQGAEWKYCRQYIMIWRENGYIFKWHLILLKCDIVQINNASISPAIYYFFRFPVCLPPLMLPLRPLDLGPPVFGFPPVFRFLAWGFPSVSAFLLRCVLWGMDTNGDYQKCSKWTKMGCIQWKPQIK